MMKSLIQFRVYGQRFGLLFLLIALSVCGEAQQEVPAESPPAATEEQPDPPESTAEFKDGGAYSEIKMVAEEFGNLETLLVATDLEKLNIAQNSMFTVTAGETTVTVKLAITYDDVPRGDWVGFVNWEGTLRLARNLENAAEALKCKAGDQIFIKPVM